MYVMIAGGGKVGYHLAKGLISAGHEVALIEKDKGRAAELFEILGETAVRGDACEVRTMKRYGMERADVVVATTGDDEDNLVICQMAKQRFQAPRTIARVNDPNNEEVFQRLGIDETVSSTKIIFNLIEREIETDQLVPIAALKRGNIEIVEIDLGSDSPVLGKEIGKLGLPPNTLIISIVRDDHALIPHVNTELESRDSVIALVESDQEPALRSIFVGER
ncbi:MAG: TrkA family potassium uptake protein [Armatimonadota bacterium]|nr:TrkA family potassium uptake protein [Armatimonadota bacterium]